MGGGQDLASVQFRDFYQVLQRASQLILKVSDADAAEAAQTLSKDLLQLIELHTIEARRIGGAIALEHESQARYLKAVLADEILLNSDWAGREHWRHELLETKLFKSSHAGEEFFRQIDQLLSNREPSQRALARLYLYVISLGFQGQYRGTDDMSMLARYRSDLFMFIFQRQAELNGAERRLSELPYENTLSDYSAHRLPRLSRSWIRLISLVLGMLILSEVMWLWQSWPVRKSLETTVGSTSIYDEYSVEEVKLC
ncbi:MAG: DotU family type IV/VI secretion system protein [Betaproteobacteria bacterium]|nr:DotU family type IV/VI secretion system protein [Betaproteobacteria bacterium]NBY05671.1 DotU family type IV/VI secretion system protein [Betaproteobacteria bacterium]